MFNTFIRIRTLIYLESATPAVDRPSVEVDGKEVDKMFVSTPPTLARSPAATLPSFISSNNKHKLYKKRGQSTVSYSIYKGKRELSSQGLIISPTKQYIYKIAWQPSLMLGDLGRARLVPIARKGSNLGLRHSKPS